MPRDEDYEGADYLIWYSNLDEDYWKFWLIKKD